MVLPQITCRTFGVRVFIRVPSPAARMMTAAGPLALTRLLGIGAGKRLEAPPAGSRSGLPQDTASPGGTPRDGQSRARRPGNAPAACQHPEPLFEYEHELRAASNCADDAP